MAPDKIRLAHHEAGHAVIATALGFECVRIDLNHSEERHGAVEIREDFPGSSDRNVYRAQEARRMLSVLHLLAGMAATWRYDGRETDIAASGGVADEQNARNLLNVAFQGHELSVDLAYRLASVRAQELVKNYWPEIERVAETLISRGSITGDEVRRLFRDSFDARQPDARHLLW